MITVMQSVRIMTPEIMQEPYTLATCGSVQQSSCFQNPAPTILLGTQEPELERKPACRWCIVLTQRSWNDNCQQVTATHSCEVMGMSAPEVLVRLSPEHQDSS